MISVKENIRVCDIRYKEFSLEPSVFTEGFFLPLLEIFLEIIVGRKGKKKQKIDVTKEAELVNNPFAGLDLPFVAAEPEVKVDKKPDAKAEDKLSPADRALLRAFGDEAIDMEVDAQEICRVKLKMRFEKKGRGGKVVTTVRGFQSDDAEYMMELLASVRKKLGTGGFLRDDSLEFQGDQTDRLPDVFHELGYKVVKG